MTSLRLLALVLVLSTAGRAQSTGRFDARANQGLVFHPTVIEVSFKRKLFPVIAARDQSAEIVYENGQRKMPHDSSYVFERAPAYLEGFVTFLDQDAQALRSRIEYTGSGMFGAGSTIDEHTAYDANLISNRELLNGYLAIVFVDQAYLDGQTDYASAQVAFQEIGHVAKGEKTRVTMRFKYINTSGRNVMYFPLVFSDGREIMSNLSGQAVRFFRRQSEVRHEMLLQAYRDRFRGEDHKAEVYERISPALVEGFVSKSAIQVDVTCSVDESGRANQVELSSSMNPSLERCIKTAVGEWRFLPRLSKGRAVRTLVKIPLDVPAMAGPE